jgi:hypothetical protein
MSLGAEFRCLKHDWVVVADDPRPKEPRHPQLRLPTSGQVARRALFRWPLRQVPVGRVGVIPDLKSSTPSAATVLPQGWHFVRSGRLVLVAEAIDTGEWPVSNAPGADPLCWVRATCEVDNPAVAAFAVADLPTAVVQQLVTAARAVGSGGASLAPQQIASAVREAVEPIFRRWGASIREVTVRDASS